MGHCTISILGPELTEQQFSMLLYKSQRQRLLSILAKKRETLPVA